MHNDEMTDATTVDWRAIWTGARQVFDDHIPQKADEADQAAADYLRTAIAAWQARTTPSHKAGPVEVERIAALRSRIAALRSRVVGTDAMPSDLLTEFGKHVGWELSYAGWDDEAEWQVHQVNGGRNDREWTLIGTGQTPAAAIRAALAPTDQGEG